MGKQFGLKLNEADFNKLCDHLHDERFILYGYSPYGKNFREYSRIKNEKLDMNTYCITKIQSSKVKPYDNNNSRFFNANFYPVIEFSNWRFWIDSRAKGMLVWNEFDEIKKWVKKNFEYRNGNFCSKE